MTWEEQAASRGGEQGPPAAGLNPAQREAVEHGSGALLILAGPGSGKTRVIVHRIVWLSERMGVEPEQILAVTFTNRAAGEMRERVWEMIDGDAGEIQIGTFHAFCARMLRYYGEAIGVDSRYVICNPEDQLTVMRDVLRRSSVAAGEQNPSKVLAAISRAKNELRDAEAMTRLAKTRTEAVAAQVRERYDHALRTAQALDFDDLLAHGLRLIQLGGEAFERTAQRYRHLLIDEFQDTNLVQYELARVLASPHGNITAVGDPDQSIYSWRAADVRNIVQFERDFANSRVVLLDQNYRSTRRILEAARAVIGLASARTERNLWTENPAGDPVVAIDFAGAPEEAAFIASEIQRTIRDDGRDFRDFAVLYRTNTQSSEIERALVRAGIPYRMSSGTRFHDRREVRDLLAWLRIVENPADSLAFRRALLAPRRGVGAGSLERMLNVVAAEDRLLPEVAVAAVADGEPQLRPAVRQALEAFLRLLEELRAATATMTASEAVRAVLAASGLQEYIAEGKDGAQRLDNIAEVLRAAVQYDDLPAEQSLAIFLEEMALTAGEPDEEVGQDAVSLSTMHGAKGLEYGLVFMAGMEEGLLPHLRASSEEQDLEEERRVCYVAMTRARERLYLLRARARFNPWESIVELREPSRFLAALPEDGVLRHSDLREAKPGAGGPRTASDAPAPRPGLAPGTLVRHAQYGEGSVVSGGPGGSSTVAFHTRDNEEILVSNSKLTPLGEDWLEAA